MTTKTPNPYAEAYTSLTDSLRDQVVRCASQMYRYAEEHAATSNPRLSQFSERWPAVLAYLAEHLAYMPPTIRDALLHALMVSSPVIGTEADRLSNRA